MTDDDKKKTLELIEKLGGKRAKGGSSKNATPKKTEQTDIMRFVSPGKEKTKTVGNVDAAESMPTSSAKRNLEVTQKVKAARGDVKKHDEKKLVKLRVEGSQTSNQKVDEGSSFAEKKPTKASKFDSFKLFCKLCDVIASVSKYTDKTSAVNMFVKKGLS